MNERATIEMAGATGAPILLIDPAAASLVEANIEGRALLGLPPATRLPAALDSAMPAIVRLRQMSGGALPLDQECLTFWGAGKLTNFHCRVAEISRDGKQLMRVSAGGTRPDESSPRHATLAPTVEPAIDSGPPPRIRDDKETLKEIARRIREGRSEWRSPSDCSNANPEPAAGKPAIVPARASQIETPRLLSGAQDLAKVAHELKTPLSAIVAASEIMRDERLGKMGNSRYLGYASDIHESAAHALAVINSMLKDASEAAGHRTGPIDLNALAAATVSAMQPLAMARRLTLEHDTSEGRLDISADATAVRQILLNLLTNSMKFTAAGGDIRVVTGYLDDGSIFMVVRDTGEGMDEDMLARAFYDEGSDRLNLRRGGGYGLGLPMVRRLAEANGAAIEIDSAPAKGTVVLISFSSQR